MFASQIEKTDAGLTVTREVDGGLETDDNRTKKEIDELPSNLPEANCSIFNQLPNVDNDKDTHKCKYKYKYKTKCPKDPAC